MIAICDAVARDPNSQKSTVYGIFDSFYASELPVEVSFFVYARIHGDAGTRKMQLRIIDENGKHIKEAGSPEFEFDFGQQKVAEVSVRVIGLKVNKGKYTVAVFCDGKKIGTSYPILVAKVAGESKKSKAKP